MALLALLPACSGASQEPSSSARITVKPRASEPPADLVLTGGTVITMDPLQPRAEALAVRGGRIVAVGAAAEVQPLVGSATKRLELHGRAVTPGLVDGHCHLYGLGAAGEMLSLRGIKSAEEVAKRVAEAQAKRKPGEWIRGRGWDQNLWTPKDFPTKAVLDRVAPDHPVVLRRIDGHSTWVNTEALRRAGISRDTKDPMGGRILRDSKGEPTGVLVDNAEELVAKKIPPDSGEARERMILAAADKAVGAGLTGVHEMGIDDETIAVYRKLAAEGRLKLRVYAFLTGEGQIASLSRRKPDVDEQGTAAFTLRAVKLYADGSLGSRSAALLAPYADEPGNSGLLLTTPEALAEAVLAASASGFQLGIHAIGDRANRMVLDAYAKVAGKDQRHRIEHAQIVAPEDIGRFAALGVVAAMQPTHATSDMPWAEARLGKDRLAGAYAWKSIMAAGAHVVGGSDFPIEEVSPLLGLDAALTRQDAQGNPPGGWLPRERLTLEEALRIYTVEPAWSSFQERNHGRIARGMVADLTVFDGDLSGGRLLSRKVDWTILGGQIVYARASDAGGT
jgi:predicted amidohydrolase YtcJ